MLLLEMLFLIKEKLRNLKMVKNNSTRNMTIIEIKNFGGTEENWNNEDSFGDPNILEENLDNYNMHLDDNVQNMSSDEENFEDAQAILNNDENVCRNGFDNRNKIWERKRFKHLDVKYHYIQELVKKQLVEIKYISIRNQVPVADILTKNLEIEQFSN